MSQSGNTTRQWLEQVPDTWEVLPAKGLFAERREPCHAEDVHLTPSQAYGVLPQEEYMAVTGSRVVLNLAGQDNMKHVEPDDFIIHLRSFQGGLEKSALRGKVSTAYTVLVPRERASADYYRWLLKCAAYIQTLRTTTNQLRDGQSIKFDDFAKVALPAPPPEVQRAIAKFLDREVAKMDALIAEQEGLVQVLQERRAALIARVLVSGLDADVAVERSRVDWLGDLPVHWRTVPTRYLCTITTGSEDSGNAETGGEYPFYVRGREVLRIGHYSFDCEAVMTPGDGQGGTGKVFHYFNGKFEAHQRVYVYKDFKNLLGRYYYYYLSTFLRPVALAGSNTVTMESLRRPVLANFPVALPPVEEQRQIVAYLDEQTEKIDRLVGEAEGVVTVAKERRAALITAAVTGQVDVQGEVA